MVNTTSIQDEQFDEFFFNKRDLANAWVQSGRSAQSFTSQKLMVVELRKFVEDMQTPVYSLWHTVRFITSSAAVAIITGQNAARKVGENTQSQDREQTPISCE